MDEQFFFCFFSSLSAIVSGRLLAATVSIPTHSPSYAILLLLFIYFCTLFFSITASLRILSVFGAFIMILYFIPSSSFFSCGVCRDWDNVLVEYYLHEKYSMEYWANVRASIDSFHYQHMPSSKLFFSFQFSISILHDATYRYIWHYIRFGIGCRIFVMMCSPESTEKASNGGWGHMKHAYKYVLAKCIDICIRIY